MIFWVYILASQRNGAIYVGHTDDLAHRIWQHRTHQTPASPRSMTSPCSYGWSRTVRVTTPSSANDRSTKWNRVWKLKLIEQLNPDWKDLYLDMGNWNPKLDAW